MAHDWAALGIKNTSIYWKMDCFFPEDSEEYLDFLYGCAKVTLTGSVQAFDEYIGMTKREHGRDVLDAMAEEVIVLILHCPYTDAAYLRQRLEILETHGIIVAHTKGLGLACNMGSESYAAVFIDFGSSPNSNFWGKPLIVNAAVYDQDPAIVKLLLQAGARPMLYELYYYGLNKGDKEYNQLTNTVYPRYIDGYNKDTGEIIIRLMLDYGADRTVLPKATVGILGDINALHATWKRVFPDFQRELMEYVFAPARLMRMGYFDWVDYEINIMQ